MRLCRKKVWLVQIVWLIRVLRDLLGVRVSAGVIKKDLVCCPIV